MLKQLVAIRNFLPTEHRVLLSSYDRGVRNGEAVMSASSLKPGAKEGMMRKLPSANENTP